MELVLSRLETMKKVHASSVIKSVQQRMINGQVNTRVLITLQALIEAYTYFYTKGSEEKKMELIYEKFKKLQKSCKEVCLSL